MPAYLLIPKRLLASTPPARAPAVLCFYGTTSGTGKERTVALSGRAPGTPPEKNSGFAVTFAQAGLVAFAADYLRDGERIKPGRRPRSPPAAQRAAVAWFQRWLAVRPEP